MRSNNYLTTSVDKELLTKALDTISIIAQNFPDYLKNALSKLNIIDFLFEILQTKDLFIMHYTIALFGDLTKLELKTIENKCEQLFEALIPCIDLKPKKNQNQSENISVCNNSIWTIGLLALYFPQKTQPYIDTIMYKFKDILKLPKVGFIINSVYR